MMKMMARLFVMLLGSALSNVLASNTPVFKDNSADFLEVGYSKGRGGERVTEISVSVDIGKLFEDGVEVDADDISLEIKTGKECWRKVGDSPMRRGKQKRMWRVKIIPCKEYSIRLGVARDDCVEYLEYPNTVGPATAVEISKSHYRPKTPGNVVVTPITDDSVLVSWAESDCAESYDLWYEADSGLDLGNITVSAGVGEVTIAGLENCTEYTLYMVSLLGEEFSNDVEVEFTTCLENDTKQPDTLVTEETDYSTCEKVDEGCKFFTTQFDELENEELFLMEENLEKDVSSNETHFDAQTGHLNSSSHLLSNIFMLLSIGLALVQ